MLLAGFGLTVRECVCIGISDVMSVCADSPPVRPRFQWVPERAPEWREVRPCRLGSANVVRPSPPKVVPSKENRAWFCDICRVCPLQNAQFLGGKPKPNIRISD